MFYSDEQKTENLNLKDAPEFVYGDSMLCDVHNKCEVFTSDKNPLNLSDEKDGVVNFMFRNTATKEMTKKGDYSGDMDVWSDHRLDG